MDDLIDRQEALSVLEQEWTAAGALDRVKDLPSAQPEPRWIPCKERMPEKHEEVLATVAEEIDIAWLNNDGIWRSRDCPETFLNKHITAWMPLPQPYERSEDE